MSDLPESPPANALSVVVKDHPLSGDSAAPGVSSAAESEANSVATIEEGIHYECTNGISSDRHRDRPGLCAPCWIGLVDPPHVLDYQSGCLSRTPRIRARATTTTVPKPMPDADSRVTNQMMERLSLESAIMKTTSMPTKSSIRARKMLTLFSWTTPHGTSHEPKKTQD